MRAFYSGVKPPITAPKAKVPAPPSWSAANAKDRIAIVTTDAELDARIRFAFRDEPYELVTVSSFEDNQDALIDTDLAIIDSRDGKGLDVVRYAWKSTRWFGYPFIGVVTKAYLDYKNGDFMMSCSGPMFDVELPEDFSPEELVSFTKRVIEASRDDSGSYRI